MQDKSSFKKSTKKLLGNAQAVDLKVLFDTYFRKPEKLLEKHPKKDGGVGGALSHSKRDESPISRLPQQQAPPVPDTGAGGGGVCHLGLDELRSRHLFEVFTQVTSVVKKKERRKRRLLREARALQKETEEQVAMMREIERIEGEYEG